MVKTPHLMREINLIQSEDLRMFAISYLEDYTPDYFWEVGASSTGKHHPKFSQGTGGLVRHTKAVVMFAQELLRLNTYAYLPDEYKDYIILACIVHDTAKYGMARYNPKEYNSHAKNASVRVAQAWAKYFDTPAPELLLLAIRSHMGQWTDNKDERPFTQIDRCVHLADYMASRSFIDIPDITEEWNRVEAENSIPPEEDDIPLADDLPVMDDLPFAMDE